ncbi:MAG: hypothetical protein HY738_14975 [Bacteroidia bacterium]|nr:hypothetical protein [Bacteroidia bacterium]
MYKFLLRLGFKRYQVKIFLLKSFFQSFFISVLLTYSCGLINPDEPIPAYLRIDTVLFTTNAVTQGENTHKITDIWVDVDGKRIGTFEIPAIFPVITEGNHRLLIMAGIKNNGISSARKIYPFFTQIRIDTFFTPEAILELTPEFNYKPEAILDDWLEGFNDPGISLDTTSFSNTCIIVINDPRNLSNRIGAVFFDSQHSRFECIKSEEMDIPGNNSEIYLELDYENDVDIQVGILIRTTGSIVNNRIVGINKSSCRNKMYIDLTSYIRSQSNAYGYKVYFSAQTEDGQTQAKIYMDNIKIVHF